MALPNSGTIKLSDIVAEFGGTAPHALTEYYGVSAGIPTSGTIKITDFYGSTGSGPIQATGGAVSDEGAWRYHCFTSTGDFTVTGLATGSFSNTIEVCLVGHGGGGGHNENSHGAGGGGGGGRFLFDKEATLQTFRATPHPGMSGSSKNGPSPTGYTEFMGEQAKGGGSGGGYGYSQGRSGGCGGGGGGSNSGGGGTQGNKGGNGGGNQTGAGGGGVGSAGAASNTSSGGSGGAPASWGAWTFSRGGSGGNKYGASQGSDAWEYGGGGGGNDNDYNPGGFKSGGASQGGLVLLRYQYR